jgi:penicillin-binding protein 1A
MAGKIFDHADGRDFKPATHGTRPTGSAGTRLAGRPSSHAHPRRRRMRIWKYAFLASAAMMTVIGAAVIGLVMGYVRSLPPIEQLEYYDPAEVSPVTDRTGQETIGEFKLKRRYVVPLSQIPERVQQAYLAIEDNRFYDHFGVDVIGILRAAIADLRPHKNIQGASTITQQLTRNILPEQVGFERTFSRKIKEAILSLQIERRYSKNQILEFYLNHIEFLYNACGVKAAASTYFSKDMDELTLADCATLAAMSNNPAFFNPFRQPRRVLDRRNLVLQRMRDLHYIGKEACKQAVAEPLELRRGYGAPSLYPYFLGALESDLTGRYGLSEGFLKQAGLRVTATVDGPIQKACTDALREGLIQVERNWEEAKPSRHEVEMKDWNGSLKPGDAFLMKILRVDQASVDVELEDWRATIPLPKVPPFYEPKKVLVAGKWLDVRVAKVLGGGRFTGHLASLQPVQGAIVVLDAHTGEVLGLVGGSNFYASAGTVYNLATQGGRQSGSSFKPFFYAAAMARGIQPNAIIVDEPVEYGTAAHPYRPMNYERNFDGPMTLIQGLEHSRNVVAIRLFEALGIKKALQAVGKFDFTEDAPCWKMPAEISTCLGTIDVSPLQLAAAYQVFANNGVGVRPEFFRSILGKDDQVAVPFKRWEEPIIDPVSAYQMLYMLRQVVLGGTGKTAVGDELPSPPYPPVAGKTGTTTDNVDCWFAGFSPDLVMIVSIGFEPPRSLGPQATGGVVAGPIWTDAFKRIVKTRKNWTMRFDVPEGVELADICAATGKLAGDACEGSGHAIFRRVPFRAGKTPTVRCDGSPITPLIAPVSGGPGLIAGYARQPSGG